MNERANLRSTRLAAYIKSEPDRKAAAATAAQERLDALNQEIARLDGETGSKRRLEDTEYIEESREIVEGVRDAVKEGTFVAFLGLSGTAADGVLFVCAAMMKKRKKAKLAAAGAAPVASGSGAVAGPSKSAAKVVEPVIEEKLEEVVEEVEEVEPEVEEEVAPKGKGKGKGKAKAAPKGKGKAK